MVQFDPNIFQRGADRYAQSNQSLIQTLMGIQQQYQKEQRLKEAKISSELEKASTPEAIQARVNQGLPVSPEDQAKLETFYQMRQQNISDMMGNVVPKYPGQPPVGQPVADGQVDPRGTFDMLSPPPVESTPLDSQPAPSPISQTPKGQLEAYKSELDIIKEQKKSDIGFERKKRESEFAKSKARPKLDSSFSSLRGDVSNIAGVIDDVIDKTDWSTSGIVGSAISGVWQPSKNLEESLKTIQADAAFGRLQEMRDNSPTGGALGQVSERELALLQSAKVALSQAQSPEQLKENLARYKQIRETALKNVANAYKSDYGSYPKGFKPKKEDETEDINDTQATEQQGLEIGAIEDGYRYTGGNPQEQSSWELVE